MNGRSVVIVALALLAAGCGDNAPSGPDAEAFCERFVADTGQIPEDSGAWDAYASTYEDLAILAPDEIGEPISVWADAARTVADGSQNFDDIYNEPGTIAAYDDIAAWTSEHCLEDGGYFPGG